MKPISEKEAKKQIERIVKHNKRLWVNSLMELGAIEINTAEEEPLTGHAGFYHYEAVYSYLYGCYRSCIFACAGVVEQEFRSWLTKDSENPENEIEELKKLFFKDVITRAKKNKNLKSFCEDACWLNDARNRVAAHPSYFSTGFSKDYTLTDWEARLLKKSFKKLLELLGKIKRNEVKKILNKTPRGADPQNLKDAFGKSFPTIREILKNDANDRKELEELGYYGTALLLPKIAFESYMKMVKIIEGLYPIRKEG